MNSPWGNLHTFALGLSWSGQAGFCSLSLVQSKQDAGRGPSPGLTCPSMPAALPAPKGQCPERSHLLPPEAQGYDPPGLFLFCF